MRKKKVAAKKEIMRKIQMVKAHQRILKDHQVIDQQEIRQVKKDVL